MVANMPLIAGAVTAVQELLREIKQHLDSGACRDGNTQSRATDQEPSMITANSSISKIKRHATDVAAAIVHSEKKPAGQVGELRLRTKSNIETDHQRPHVGQATADAGQWRRDNIAHPLVGVRRQKARFAHGGDEASRQRVGEAPKLYACAGCELQITAAELVRDPAQ